MNTMSIDDFEDAYEDAKPINGYVLVEIVEKDTTRKTKSGILVSEESIGNALPYLVVVDVSQDLSLSFGGRVQAGDIIQVNSGQLSAFYGKDLKKYSLINFTSISAVYKKKEGVTIPVKEVKDSKIILNN